MASPAKRTEAPIDPWKLVSEINVEVKAKGIQAGYDLLLLHLDDLDDDALIYPVLKNVEIPKGTDVPRRIKDVQRLDQITYRFLYQAQSDLDFGRSVGTFEGIFKAARSLPKALFHVFIQTAAHTGQWSRCDHMIMTAFSRIDSPPLDDVDFEYVKAVFEKSKDYVTPRMIRGVDQDASPRMKVMIGSIGVRMPELGGAVDAYLACGVDPLTVEGANQTLCAVVRRARETL